MIPQADDIFHEFAKHGYEIYLVGGFVRDIFLAERSGTPVQVTDLDFATSALPEQTSAVLRKMGLPDIPIGVEFGTVGSLVGETPVEITTYRCEESYKKGSRKPSVTFGKTLTEDLRRRDFTINAMALDRSGKLHDPFGGKRDMDSLTLATPCDPRKTFQDDPLRMLRLYRFASQLNASTAQDLCRIVGEQKKEIHNVSVERIFQEMSKLLKGDSAAYALRIMGESGLLGEIFPELQTVIDFKQNQGKWHSKLVWPHVLDVVDNSPPIREVRWAALFHDIAKPETYSETETGVHFYEHEPRGASIWNTIADRLKVSNEFKQEIYYLIYHHLRFSQLCSVFPRRVSQAALRRFIRDCGPYLENLYLLSMADITSHKPDTVKAKREQCIALKKRLDEIIAQCDVRKLKLPKGLGGQVAEALQISKGPALGRIMRQLNHMLISGDLDEDSDFVAAARAYQKKRISDGLRELVRLSEEAGGYQELRRFQKPRGPE